jgi:hypothetical protein
MAAEPVLKLATDYVRIAVANFQVGFSPPVESELLRTGLTVVDLNNALSCCRATWTNKSEAADALFEVEEETTEGVILHIRVRVNPNSRNVSVENVFVKEVS